MLAAVIRYFAHLTTIALHIYFIYRSLSAKTGVKQQVLAAALFIAARMVYFGLGWDLRTGWSIAAGFIYACAVFRGNSFSYLICSIIPVVLDSIIDACTFSSVYLLADIGGVKIGGDSLARSIIFVLANILMFAVYYLVTLRAEKYRAIHWSDLISLMVMPCGSWFILSVVYKYTGLSDDAAALPVLTLVNLFLLMMTLSGVALYNRTAVQERKLARSQTKLKVAEITKRHISQINETHRKLSTLRHDLKNHLVSIMGLLSENKHDEIAAYINEVSAVYMSDGEYAGNPVINALISARETMAKEIGIKFDYSISLPENLPVTDVELCVIFGSILDNAFEANETSGAGKFIDLTARVADRYWAVVCRTPSNKRELLRATGSLPSTKTVPGIHGIGTSQLKDIAEKYGGFVTYKNMNYEFSVHVLISLAD